MNEVVALLFEPPTRVPLWTILGLLWGSFLNVCIARLPVSENVVSGRSRCPRCAHLIRWYDNIPLVSYLVLRGRCRDCKLPIAWRYPAVEVANAVLFLGTLMAFDWDPRCTVYLPFVAGLLAITVIDLHHRIIPDELSLGLLAVGVVLVPLVGLLGWVESMGAAALGYALFFGLAWGYKRFRGIEGLGGGDVKMLAMIGAWLGPLSIMPVIVVASLAGAVVGALVALRRGKVRDTAIPFGPFLAMGALAFLFARPFWQDLLWPQGMP